MREIQSQSTAQGNSSWQRNPAARFQVSVHCVRVLCPSSSTTKLRGCSAEPQIQENPPSRALSLENAGQPLLALEMVSVLRCRGRSAGGRCWGDGFRWLPVGKAGSFSSSLSSPFNGQSKFLAFCILQGFLVFCFVLFVCLFSWFSVN